MTDSTPPQPPPQPQSISYASTTIAPRSNTWGIVSLVCGCLLCVPFLPGLLATVFGILGIKKSREPNTNGKGMAIAGLVLGILNLAGWSAYFVLIIAIMVPALGRARAAAATVACAANMNQIGAALSAYAGENNGQFPPSLQELKGLTINCPSPDSAALALPYVYLGAGKSTSSSPDTLLLHEPLVNHSGGANFLYVDGSVHFHDSTEAQKLITELSVGHNPPRFKATKGKDLFKELEVD